MRALSVAVNEVWTGLPDLVQMQRLNVQMGSIAVQVADLRGQRQTAQPEEVYVLDSAGQPAPAALVDFFGPIAVPPSARK